MIVVSDTTAISNLLQIGELGILRKLFGKVLIPKAVFEELLYFSQTGIPIASILEKNSIEVGEVAPDPLLERLLIDLDLGEAEAIVLAVEKDADFLLIDEKVGRAKAREFSFKIVGTLGILLEGIKEGYLENLQEKMDALRSIGFWISDNLYREVLDIERRLK